jgi:hypothetical protein
MELDTLESVRSGHATQWIRVCGANAANPVLLIQQGPGLPMINEARRFQHLLGLEQAFTVVYWDQRHSRVLPPMIGPARWNPGPAVCGMEDRSYVPRGRMGPARCSTGPVAARPADSDAGCGWGERGAWDGAMPAMANQRELSHTPGVTAIQWIHPLSV